MRRRPIAWFERLFVLSVTASFLVRIWRFPMMVQNSGPIEMLFILALFLVIPVALALLVSRRRSLVALLFLLLFMWVHVLVIASGLVRLRPVSLVEIVTVLLTATPLAVTLLLLTPRSWLMASPARRSPTKS